MYTSMPRNCELKRAEHQTAHASADRLQRFARERADERARRIPWQRLLEARNQYIDWQEFYLWGRSILEVENRVPDWLIETLNNRCPGFLESEKKLRPKAAKTRPLPFRLKDWIDNQIFGFAKREGWFSAITFYSVREPRYQRAEVCWSECVEKWERAKPIRYPSFEEWKEMAAQCDSTAHLLPQVGKVMAPARRIDANRFAEAVSQYIDWEAFAFWVRPALELGSLPEEIVREFSRRCPGFLVAQPGGRDWQQLMSWIADHYFQDAKSEGWFDAVLLHAHDHPRAIRTMEYADHCEDIWGSQLPEPYPSFEDWRSNADSYVEPPNAMPGVSGS